MHKSLHFVHNNIEIQTICVHPVPNFKATLGRVTINKLSQFTSLLTHACRHLSPQNLKTESYTLRIEACIGNV